MDYFKHVQVLEARVKELERLLLTMLPDLAKGEQKKVLDVLYPESRK
jgi:hypothetical protein